MIDKKLIPKEIISNVKTLKDGGFEAYLVGGCVRDVINKTKPKDWDITTNATPEEIIASFGHTFYENTFGTVGVVNEGAEDQTLQTVEITPYRTEGAYSDSRRPDEVKFTKNIEEDLKRRDFTINSIAYDPIEEKLIDLFEGIKDIKEKTIRAVGNPEERFAEDALRILRAIRLSAELNFKIEEKTKVALKNNAALLKNISKERIRDEFIRLINSDRPMEGIILAKETGVLKYITPELERGIGIDQNQAHKYDVFEHNLRTLKHAADKGWGLDLRLSSLFHDVSKPETRRFSKEKKDWTFYGHDVVGAKLTKKILSDLKFPKKTVEKITKMVRWHMFFSDPEKITLSAVRRLIVNIGKEEIWELMNLRICDRIGTGRPKENPYRFRKYKSMVEEAMRDPLSVGMLKIDGNQIKSILGIEPSPKIGFILHALLEEVLDNPSLNSDEKLAQRARELGEMSLEDLKKIGEKGKERKKKEEEESIKEIRKKYYVE